MPSVGEPSDYFVNRQDIDRKVKKRPEYPGLFPSVIRISLKHLHSQLREVWFDACSEKWTIQELRTGLRR